MATGKVLQFDHVRGYGFVAADDGGEDVFLHASAFDGDPSELSPGVDVEFQVMAGDRGRKAYAVRFAEGGAFTKEEQFIPPIVAPLVSPEATLGKAPEEEQMCDVLSQAEFSGALTELLLNAVPALTGQQILEVRRGMLEFATKRGWVDA